MGETSKENSPIPVAMVSPIHKTREILGFSYI